ncbi:MAG: NADH-quinone oxidoreductase subunit NuoE family protein [Desulfotomaculales bacterium]
MDRRRPSGQERNYLILDKFIERYRGRPGGLVRILFKAQELFGYLSPEIQAYVAEKTDLPVSHIYGVATFYSRFVTEPPGKYRIGVCMGTACYVKDARAVLDRFQAALGVREGETTSDGMFSLRTTRCLGACSLSPVITVNDDMVGEVTPDGVADIIRRCREAEAEEETERVPERRRPERDERAAPPGP